MSLASALFYSLTFVCNMLVCDCLLVDSLWPHLFCIFDRFSFCYFESSVTVVVLRFEILAIFVSSREMRRIRGVEKMYAS